MFEKKAFTLVELLITMMLLFTISVATYAPYNYYKNKSKLKNSLTAISQVLYESRNKAMNGSIGNNGNVSIGVYFDNRNKNNIEIFSYPHDIDNSLISNITSSDVKKISNVRLSDGIQIDSIEGKNNFLFLFNSISGEVEYYTWNSSVRSQVTDDEISINISYKGSNSINLKKTLNYFTSTYIIDYK